MRGMKQNFGEVYIHILEFKCFSCHILSHSHIKCKNKKIVRKTKKDVLLIVLKLIVSMDTVIKERYFVLLQKAIREFFKPLKLTSIRIPKNAMKRPIGI